MDLGIAGKRALVFGGSQGIGKAIAQALVNEGVTVAISARNEDTLEQAADEIGADCFFSSDLTQPGQAAEVVRLCKKKWGGLDILVNNTGGPAKGQFLEVSMEQWQQDYQNLWLSAVEALHESLPSMMEQNFGRVLMITSIAAKEPLPGLTTSNGLRAGLAGLCKSIATEVAAKGVTINLLLPGYTITDRIKALNLADEKIKDMVPAGRLGEPEEIAALAAFLCSKQAGYITSQSIAVDGGVLKGIS